MVRVLAAALVLCSVADTRAETAEPSDATAPRAYYYVARDVFRMIGNQPVKRHLRRKRLQVLNVLWEDTGRYFGSSVGPNISDVTIAVEAKTPRGRRRTFLMPVIRYPNFTDKTADLDLDKFFVRVGNHEPDGALTTISLRELLEHPADYLSHPDQGRIRGGSLLAKRDTHVLVSAQAAFLPIPHDDNATFWPVIFNYQSYPGNPAVLTILVTHQGTSMTIIDNERDTVDSDDAWGQRLYFNDGGERAPLIAERLADVQRKGVTANGLDAGSVPTDANVLMLIQVPLRMRPERRSKAAPSFKALEDSAGYGMGGGGGRESDVDRAVLGHGPSEGPYTELDGLTIARDPRFPIRVTVQFYQATSNGVVTTDDLDVITARIDSVYERGDFVGSLVTGPSNRPTLWTGATGEPWGLTWADFPGLVRRYQRTRHALAFMLP